MTNKSISQLNAGASVASTDLFPDVQTVGVGPVKVTAAQIGNYVLTGSGMNGALTLGTAGSVAGSLILSGSSSGTITVQTPAAAGSWSMTLPSTAGTNNYVLTTNGSGVSSWSQVSLTAGVTGILPVANGGTGQSTNTIHGVLIGNAGSAINATTAGSNGQLLTSSGASADPTWTTATYPSTTSAGTILVSATTSAVTASSSPTLGVQQTTQGSLILANTAAGAFSTTLKSSNSATEAWSLTLPVSKGTSGYVLTTDGTGISSWSNPTSLGIDLDVGSTAITNGTTTRVLFDNGGLLGEASSLTITATTNKVGVISAPFGLSGDISSTAWTTSGIRYQNIAATLTDTSSSGTVANAYTDFFGSNTIAASNVTTFTNYYTMYIGSPSAGTNVTLTNPYSLGTAGNVNIGGSLKLGTQLSVADGGTGLTSLTSGYIPYGNGTGAFSSSSNFIWTGSNFAVVGTSTIQYPSGGGTYGNSLTIYSGGGDIEIREGTSGSGYGYLWTGTTHSLVLGTVGAERVRCDTSGNVIINTAAIATNATDGFLYVPTCAGTPTGTPTTYTGRAPIVVNTTNNKLYFYSGGAWRDAGP